MQHLRFLDNLKLALTLLVIFHHVAMPYSGVVNWVYRPSDIGEMMPGIWHFLSSNAAFFMGLFFMISGYLVPSSYDRRGGESFVQKKLIRLGIPLLIVTTIFSSITSDLEMGHMWFVESLLFFNIIYAVWRLLRHLPRFKEAPQYIPTLPGLAAVAVVLGIASVLVRHVSPQDSWIWLLGFIRIEPAHYLQYMVMFVLGIMAHNNRWFENMKQHVGLTSLIVGLMLVAGNYLRGAGGWGDFVGRWFGLYESMLCVFLCFGLVWFFGRYCNADTPFLSWCASQSYGAYVMHLPIVLGLQFLLDDIPMAGGPGKLIFIGVAASIFSYGLTWLIRRIPVVRRVL